MDPLDGEPCIPGSYAWIRRARRWGSSGHPPAGAHPWAATPKPSIGDDQVVAAWPTTTSPPWPTSAGGPVAYRDTHRRHHQVIADIRDRLMAAGPIRKRADPPQ